MWKNTDTVKAMLAKACALLQTTLGGHKNNCKSQASNLKHTLLQLVFDKAREFARAQIYISFALNGLPWISVWRSIWNFSLSRLLPESALCSALCRPCAGLVQRFWSQPLKNLAREDGEG